MTFLAKPRTLETFYEKSQQKSPSYLKNVRYTIENIFAKFCKEKFDKSLEEIIQELKKSDEDTVYDTLNEWINWVNKPRAIRAYYSHLINYLYYRGIKINSQDTRQNIVFGKKPEEEHYPISIEAFRKILGVASYENQALYLLLSSSGMRPIEAIKIRKQDIEIDKNLIIHVPAKWTKLKRAKITSCTKEATIKLIPIIKRKKDHETLFGANSTNSVDTTFHRYVEKVGLDKKSGSGRNKISPMSLRAYFITKVSRHDPNLAKKMSGQKGYLLTYDRMTQEEILEEYLKCESDLIIDDKERIKIENEMLKKNKVTNEEVMKMLEHVKDLAEEAEQKRLLMEEKQKKLMDLVNRN